MHKKRRSILLIAPRVHTNTVCFNRLLSKLGFDIIYAVIERHQTEDYSGITKVLRRRTQSTQGGTLFWIAVWSFQVLRYAILERPELIVVRISDRRIRLTGYLAALAGGAVGARVIYYQQADYESISRLYRPGTLSCLEFWLRLQVRNSVWVTPLGDIYRRDRKEQKKTFIVPFVESCSAKIDLRVHSEQRRFLCIGRMIERKRHQWLLDCWESKQRQLMGAKLDIVGQVFNECDNEYQGWLENEIRKRGLEDVVRLSVNLPREEVLKMIPRYDWMVLPAVREPASFAVIEALARSVPVICANDCGTSCYVKDDITGYIFDSASQKDFIRRVVRASRISVEEHELMRRNARRAYKEAFSPKSFIRAAANAIMEGTEGL